MEFRTEPDGSRSAWKGNINIAREGAGDSEKYVRWLLQLRDAGIHSGRVAHIGGGFCVMARLMGPAYEHFIYEIEPDFAQFAPPEATFVLGDYKDTFTGNFDVVIHDVTDSFIERNRHA